MGRFWSPFSPLPGVTLMTMLLCCTTLQWALIKIVKQLTLKKGDYSGIWGGGAQCLNMGSSKQKQKRKCEDLTHAVAGVC